MNLPILPSPVRQHGLVRRRGLVPCSCVLLLLAVPVLRGKPDAPFTHPGIYLDRQDLEFMRTQVRQGVEPWLTAYHTLRMTTPADFEPKPLTHLIFKTPRDATEEQRAKLNRREEIKAAARLTLSHALLWTVSGEPVHAEKAIRIFEQLSQGLWVFDENGAKLMAAQHCLALANAAEILRHAYPGWKESHTAAVNRILMGSIYPVLRFYYPEANGNWDAAIVQALMSIAVFTDNRPLYENAVQHFLYGPANGSLFKYIYPSGQCQEATRDQSHSQMGLTLGAQAARIAYLQGTDLFSLGDHRLALGFEYVSRYLLGEEPHAYGVISTKSREKMKDDYYFVLHHYAAAGVAMPYTEKLVHQLIERFKGTAAATAAAAPWTSAQYMESLDGRRLEVDAAAILMSMRAHQTRPRPAAVKTVAASPIAFPAGAGSSHLPAPTAEVIRVKPGESLQAALNQAAGSGRTVVALAGVHPLANTLLIPSNTTLRGEGRKTILLGGVGSGFSAIEARDRNLANVTLADFVLEGANVVNTDPANGSRFTRTGKFANEMNGINLAGESEGAFTDITLTNLTVNNFSRNGVIVSGTRRLIIERCDISDNGSYIVPGPRLTHNLRLLHVQHATIKDCRLDTSLKGAGLAADFCSDVVVSSCEVARNGWYGIVIAECDRLAIERCLIEASDSSGICLSFLLRGSTDVSVVGNRIQYNRGYGLESHRTGNLRSHGNTYDLNARRDPLELISDQPSLILEHLVEAR